MIEFFLGPFLVWFPASFFVLIFFVALYLYVAKNSRIKNILPRNITYAKLAMVLIVFRVCFAAFKTWAQYYVWSHDAIGKFFLGASLNPLLQEVTFAKYIPGLFANPFGYFLFYSVGRFWLNIFLVLGGAFLFYFLLRLFKRHNERFFEAGETELGLLMALVVGWPHLILFIFLSFIFVVFVALFRMALGRHYTTLGIPFLLATVTVLCVGTFLLRITGFDVLTV